MGMSTSNNTSVKQPVLNTPSAGKKHQISPGVSLISGGIAGGVEAATTGTTFKAGVRFLSFDSIRNALMDEKGKLVPARGILAGMIAGCVESVVAVTPTERVKTALIDDAKSSTRKYSGGTHALFSMLKNHQKAPVSAVIPAGLRLFQAPGAFRVCIRFQRVGGAQKSVSLGDVVGQGGEPR
ncbi:hypothetical protein K4K58_003324 [Colletotrichum sp. SAR11_239]|nr:hypothetical protein K4K58_003324 [Colletotrichum sp. SAR11_239]